jgi:hypothetical protein
MNQLLAYGSVLLALGVWIYSYGFVDFNLTLASHPWVTGTIDWIRTLTMFHRDQSVWVYLGILVGQFGLYLLLYLCTPRTKPPFSWKWLLVISLLYASMYPMLSSDVFKYLFAGREVLVYHANPHQVAPQVFEGDAWLRFMRWIHTPSPYGPVMTGIAIITYTLGLGKFTLTLYLYKLMNWGWYLLAFWLIGKMTKSWRAQWAFALHPLILMEWLMNGHNDAAMITLALLAIYMVSSGRRLLSWVVLILSIGIKYVTVLFVPLVVLPTWKRTWVQGAVLVLLALAPLLYHYSYQYQPWYVTWLIPLGLLLGNVAIEGAILAYALGALLRYLPFIATGLWQGTATTFTLLTFGPLGIYSSAWLIGRVVHRLRVRHT